MDWQPKRSTCLPENGDSGVVMGERRAAGASLRREKTGGRQGDKGRAPQNECKQPLRLFRAARFPRPANAKSLTDCVDHREAHLLLRPALLPAPWSREKSSTRQFPTRGN